jgi:hypothetical protein
LNDHKQKILAFAGETGEELVFMQPEQKMRGSSKVNIGGASKLEGIDVLG